MGWEDNVDHAPNFSAPIDNGARNVMILRAQKSPSIPPVGGGLRLFIALLVYVGGGWWEG